MLHTTICLCHGHCHLYCMLSTATYLCHEHCCFISHTSMCTATCLVLKYSTIYIFNAMGTTAIHCMLNIAACFEVLLHIYAMRTAALYYALLHTSCHGQHHLLGVLSHVVPLNTDKYQSNQPI